MFSWFRKQPKREAAVVTPSVIRDTARGLRGGERRSVPSDAVVGTDLFNAINTKFAGQPGKTRAQVIQLFRTLAESDDDVAGALRDVVALAVTRISWELHGADNAVARAEVELEQLFDRVFPTGLQGLAEHQARELYLTGASSLEWVPTERADGVEYAAVVPTESIIIKRDGDWYRYWQAPQGGVMSNVGAVELDTRTYKYTALTLSSDNPYGIPAGISALPMLNRKHDILKGEDRLIQAAQNLALVTAAVANPDPESLGCTSTRDEKYQAALGEYMAAIADLMAAGSENGLYVHPDGIDVTTTNLNQNLQGATDISEKNQKFIWSGLGTQGYLRGDLSANYALARVIHPQVIAFSETIRRSVITALEFGLNLHLRLAGVPAWVEVTFDDPPNPFRLEDAQAEHQLAETDKLMLELVGDAWLAKISARTGLAEDELITSRESEGDNEAFA